MTSAEHQVSPVYRAWADACRAAEDRLRAAVAPGVTDADAAQAAAQAAAARAWAALRTGMADVCPDF